MIKELADADFDMKYVRTKRRTERKQCTKSRTTTIILCGVVNIEVYTVSTSKNVVQVIPRVSRTYPRAFAFQIPLPHRRPLICSATPPELKSSHLQEGRGDNCWLQCEA